MSEQLWHDVDEFFESALLKDDESLRFAIENSKQRDLPEIAVTPHLGSFLHMIAKTSGAQRILEIGTLGGYSTIWLARALGESGEVVTLELEDHHADVAQQNLEHARVDNRVTIQRGPALQSLKQMCGDRITPFDFVFIDADKENSLPYFEASLQLTTSNAILVVDNVVRGGEVLDAQSEDSRVQGVQRLIKFLRNCQAVECSFLQTVGAKGYDGFVVARKLATEQSQRAV